MSETPWISLLPSLGSIEASVTETLFTTLDQLFKGDRAIITAIDSNSHAEGMSMATRLMEMGFVEGSTVEVVFEAPFSKDPLAVKVRDTLIALRRSEAALIKVKRISGR